MDADTCAIRPYDGITINYNWRFNLAYSKATKLKRLRKVTIIEGNGRDLLKEDGHEVDPTSIVEEEVDEIMEDLEISEGEEMEKWKDLNGSLRILWWNFVIDY
jgi:endo-alpha-1,4-polygalactosaminidase (GH114 family)